MQNCVLLHGNYKVVVSFFSAMTLVGFGKDPRFGDFWLIRNSYGINCKKFDWIEKFFKIFFVSRG